METKEALPTSVLGEQAGKELLGQVALGFLVAPGVADECQHRRIIGFAEFMAYRPRPAEESRGRRRRRSASFAIRLGRQPSTRNTGMATRLARITQLLNLAAREPKNFSSSLGLYDRAGCSPA